MMTCPMMHASAAFARASKLAILVCVACTAFSYTQGGQWNNGIGEAHQRRNKKQEAARFLLAPPDGPTYLASHGGGSNLLLRRHKKVYG